MRIFLDTNVVIDYLVARGDTAKVAKIFESIDDGIYTGVISVGSYYTITYLVERYLKDAGYANPERLIRLRELLSELLSSLEIANLSRDGLLLATNNLLFRDLEDSYQFQSAISSWCQCFITGNIKDFRQSDSAVIEILTPEEFATSYLSGR